MQFDRFWLHTKFINTHPFCSLSIFHSYSIVVGQQQTAWVGWYVIISPFTDEHDPARVSPSPQRTLCFKSRRDYNPRQRAAIFRSQGKRKLLSWKHVNRWQRGVQVTHSPEKAAKFRGMLDNYYYYLLSSLCNAHPTKKWRSPSNQLPEWLRPVQHLQTVFTFHCCYCTH